MHSFEEIQDSLLSAAWTCWSGRWNDV